MELKLQPLLKQNLFLAQGMVQYLNVLECSTDELHSLLSSMQEKNPFLKVQFKHSNYKECTSEIKDSSTDFSQEILDQLLHLNLSTRLKYIIKLILADLSETGFLTQKPAEMALCFQALREEIDEALRLLKGCEPEGLGSATLQEFLVLQADKHPTAVKDVLQNYYGLFLHQKWTELSRRSGYSLEEIKEVCGCVSKMKTRPLSGESQEIMIIRPDVSINNRDGKLHIQFHEHAFPQTFFDGEYGEENVEVKKYLKEQYEEVRILKEQLELRKETIRKIAEEIAKRQVDFFQKGPEALKSLTMTELARSLNLHVSTISRAVKEKYMATPYGTFSFRHFFSTSNQFLDESKMTVNQLKKFIFTTIKTENKKKPLSDQDIAKKLRAEGIEVSRRVIAKYRHQLNLPGSSKRKELFHIK